MAITLKEETILNQWSTLLTQGARQAGALMGAIEAQVRAAQIPGGVSVSLDEVQSGGFMSKTRREFLIVKLEQFSDYRMYIGCRPYGVHLDVCRFVTVEPGFFKKAIANQLGGSADALSAPKNILVEQDLRAWVTTVHHAVLSATESVMRDLGQNPATLNRQSKGFLEIW